MIAEPEWAQDQQLSLQLVLDTRRHSKVNVVIEHHPHFGAIPEGRGESQLPHRR